MTGSSARSSRRPEQRGPSGVKDVESKIQVMLEYRELASQMRKEIPTLAETYPDRWVAMTPGGELFVGDSMDEILDVLDERRLRDGNVVIEFLASNPATLIL